MNGIQWIFNEMLKKFQSGTEQTIHKPQTHIGHLVQSYDYLCKFECYGLYK